MKSLLIFVSFFAVSAFAQNGKEAVATVGNKTITLEDFNRRYNDVKAQTGNPPSKETFLEDLIRYEMGLQEAEKRKLNQDPVVQDRMRQELYKALIEKDIGERIQKTPVSEKETEAYFKKNPEIRTSHILIEVKPGATPAQVAEARKRATEIYNEVKASKRPFEELVKLYSDDPLSKQTGGDVGWQGRISLVPAYYNAATKLEVGQISNLVETGFGLHIIKVTGRRSFANADKRSLRAAVFDEKRRETFNEYFDKMKKNYKITTNKKLIE